MLLEKPILHKLAEEAIKELARDGVTCDPGEILWLQAMAEKVVYPTRTEELLFLDMPVPCGNAMLWPLSIGARMWLHNYGRPWFEESGKLQQLVVAFAMAHSRQLETLTALTSKLKARFKIALFGWQLRASPNEISVAVARCLTTQDYDLVEVAGPPAPKNKVQTTDYGDCIALLCHFYGQSPDYWLWKASEDACAALLNKVSTVMPTDRKVDSKSSKFNSFSTFRLVVNHIRELHKSTK